MANNKIANPAPLGLAGFALTTFVLSFYNAEILSTGEAIVFPLALFYGGLAQFMAGMWEFKTGNTFGATAFTSYGAWWMFFALFEYSITLGWIDLGANAATSVGLVLIAWGIFTFYMWLGTFKLNRALWLIFLTLWITFFLLALGDLVAPKFGILGGYMGIICALIAWYTSAAEIINDVSDETVLPLGEKNISA
ncbi:acetate uptake transporter [Acetohalobium arabaticum]|uniref:GPR1/FUN34/yaaH family protein n=1 Tax=Acetohalobium arabaticum (strain ATCC 49924 / DSM 5501 / Z-7288) TaxID=574087 RepID=D9QS94_ACEAZ|nr:GPR1/FUN34/YaaH family transporter [Acetohalobium arabaticum]ADL13385.1 GPR1/FUN34/yaaH family protein [Acetohalobium arabaticum DSM 5501]